MDNIEKLRGALPEKKSWLRADGPEYIFGPCSAESAEQVMKTADGLAHRFSDIYFRASVWKPRTRPGGFEGSGVEGLQWLKEVKQKHGFKICTEVAYAQHVYECLKAGVDMVWIGARTTVNPFSVQEIADALKGTDIVVMVKNPLHPELALWIGALERISNAGIKKIAAIHRGFHIAGASSFRNPPNWEMVIELKRKIPELPIITDASHICGKPALIPIIAQKALDMAMDGLMIESHIDPINALSDAAQQVKPEELISIIDGLVVRHPETVSESFNDQLTILRSKIDNIDDTIIEQMGARMELVREIGNYKKSNNVTILQVDRWEEILRRSNEVGDKLGLDRKFIKQLLSLIHDESIRQQTKVMNIEEKSLKS